MFEREPRPFRRVYAGLSGCSHDDGPWKDFAAGIRRRLLGFVRVLTWWAEMLLFGFLVLPVLVNHHLLLVE